VKREDTTTEERWKALKEVIIKETMDIVGHHKGLSLPPPP